MSGYLPDNDEQFARWMQNCIALLSMHAGDLGVESPEMTVAARGVLAA